MKVHKFSRAALPLFERLAHLLGANQKGLKPLIHLEFSKENFIKQIALKQNFSKTQRQILLDSLSRQYHDSQLEIPEHLKFLLNENCFTVCTGHQLNLFTGPLYTIYKIAHTIKLAAVLNKTYPNYKFLPVFWMASEDHDFEEVNHFNIGLEKLIWRNNQTGAVGRMRPENWSEWQERLIQLFPANREKIEALCANYSGNTWAQATRKLFNFLFRETELIIIDGDDKALKSIFGPVMKLELETQMAYHATRISAQMLKDKNLKEQALVRDINLFCLDDDDRKRLECTQGRFKIGNESFTKEELMQKIVNQPEQFSPNVILRPLYQEMVLPNLCYIGGPGELAYWLQLRPVFDAMEIPFPLIQLRFSAQIISEKQMRRIQKMGFDFVSFSRDKKLVLKELLNTKTRRNKTLEDQRLKNALDAIEKVMVEQALIVDKTLVASALARIKNIQKELEAFESKLQRHERRQHLEVLSMAEILHETLFPNGKLQERHNNFLPYYLESGGRLIAWLIDAFDPFEDEFLVIEI